MRISEKLLLFLSRNPRTDQIAKEQRWISTSDALRLLSESYPQFLHVIRDKRILDFGCGLGFQSVALAQKGASFVLGVDINEKALGKARSLSRQMGVDAKVKFEKDLPIIYRDYFDVVISQNSFEHFEEPVKILELMKLALKQNGKLIVSFGPPWFSPYGVHMFFFVKIPWVNILFSEKTVVNVRHLYKNDTAMSYKDLGLNKMTISKFESIIADSNMEIEYLKYHCVKHVDFLAKIPKLRELFINHVTCVMVRKK